MPESEWRGNAMLESRMNGRFQTSDQRARLPVIVRSEPFARERWPNN